MAVYFAQIFIIWAFGILGNTHKSQRNKIRYMFFAFSILILIAALRKYTVGRDLNSHYAFQYSQIIYYNWSEMMIFSTLSQYGIGYCYFIKFLSLISTDVQFYIIITSFIIYGSIGYFIYKNSTDVVMSTCLFVLFCMYYMFMNIICQALAVSLVLIVYNFLINKKLKKKRYVLFIAFILLAYLVHPSALVCLIFLLLERLEIKRSHFILAIVASVLAFMYYSQLYEIMVQIFGSEKYASYITNERESQGSFNMQSLTMLILTAIPYAIGYITFIRKSGKGITLNDQSRDNSLIINDNFLMYAALLAIICRLLMFRMNIINRLSFYFMPFILILYPRVIQKLPGVNNRRIVRVFTYFIFTIYFIGMTFMYAERFYGTIPYEFFWQ